MLGRFSAALLTLLAVAALQLVLLSSPAHAIGGTPDETWMTNGTVFAQTLSEDKKTLYIGGRFTALRDRDGNQTPVTNLAAIDVATGEPVRTWKPRVTGDRAIVQSIVAKDGRLFVGGNFSAVNGTARQNLAEVDPANGSLRPFAPEITYVNNTLPPTVNTMLMDGSRLYVAGDFNRADGETRPKLAAFGLATGALDNAWKPRASRVVKDMEFDSTGETIIAVGRFATVTGSDGATASRYTVARFHTDTGNVHPWAIPDGVIGETAQTGWDALVTPTRLYAGFGDKGPNYAAAFRLDNGDVGTQLWRYGTVGDVQTLGLSPDGTRLYFGGHFGLVRLNQTVCGGRQLEGLASLNPTTGQLYCDWIPQLRPTDNNGNGPRAEMVVTNDSHLWVGGGFNEGVSGVAQRNLARFSLVETIPNPTPISEVKVNFQPAEAAVPPGYVNDFGEPFGSRNRADQGSGLYYGWVASGTDQPISLVGDGRERNIMADQRLDTLMHMQRSAQGSWEMLVPNGGYEVTVSAGDGSFIDSVYRINVEGQTAIDGAVPTNETRFFSDTRTVEVTDQRLTVDAIGGLNTKINYIDVRSLD